MQFCEIAPFVRFARGITLTAEAAYEEVIPLDARLFYVRGGYGKIKVGDTVYEMPRHALLLIGAGVAYRLLTPEVGVEYLAVNFDLTQAGAHRPLPIRPVPTARFTPDMLIAPVTVEDCAPLSHALYIKGGEGYEAGLLAIMEEHAKKLAYYREKSGHMLAELLTDAVRHASLAPIGHERDTEERLLAYVREHYKEGLTNLTVGRAFGYHPNYVSALVKRTTGMPLRRYLLHVRLMHAARLLETTAMSVGVVAVACGFCDAAYFSGYFKRYFGVAPSHYRQV